MSTLAFTTHSFLRSDPGAAPLFRDLLHSSCRANSLRPFAPQVQTLELRGEQPQASVLRCTQLRLKSPDESSLAMFSIPIENADNSHEY